MGDRGADGESVAAFVGMAVQPPVLIVATLLKLLALLKLAGTWSKPAVASLIVLETTVGALQLNSTAVPTFARVFDL